MSKWIEIGIGLLVVIPLTKLVSDTLTSPGSIVAEAADTSVGTEGQFVLILFKFWPILFGLALLAIAIYAIYKRSQKKYGGE